MKKCSHCGSENKDSAKFCIKCGEPLAGVSGDAQKLQEDSRQAEEHDEKAEPMDDAGASNSAAADDDNTAATDKTDVIAPAQEAAKTEGTPDDSDSVSPYAAAKKKMPDFLQSEKGKRIAVIGAVAIIAIIAVVFIFTGRGPSDSLIKSDFASTDFSSVAKPDDAYEAGGNYEVSSFKIVKKEKGEASTNLFNTEMWEVVVDATLSNGSADVKGTWHAYYYKNGNSWGQFIGFTNDSVTYEPKSGVDESKIIADAEKVFNGGYPSSSLSTSDSDITYEVKDHVTNGTTGETPGLLRFPQHPTGR